MTGLLAAGLAAAPASPASAYAGWTTVMDHPGEGVILVCKERSDDVYGPLWRVKIAVLSGRGYVASGTFLIKRYGQTIKRQHASARDGAWVMFETYASRNWPDTIESSVIGTSNLAGQGYGGKWEPVQVTSLANCA